MSVLKNWMCIVLLFAILFFLLVILGHEVFYNSWTKRDNNLVVFCGDTGAEVADRYHSHGSCLYYYVGNYLNLLWLFGVSHLYC